MSVQDGVESRIEKSACHVQLIMYFIKNCTSCRAGPRLLGRQRICCWQLAVWAVSDLASNPGTNASSDVTQFCCVGKLHGQLFSRIRKRVPLVLVRVMANGGTT